MRIFLAIASIPAVLGLGGAMEGLETSIEIQRQQLERFRAILNPSPIQRRASIPFNNPQAQKFFVDGSTIPDVNFDAGPSWAGLLPISAASDETRRLFFWLWPTTNPAKSKDLVFWTNGSTLHQLFFFLSHQTGGPGCSSLEGFLQENGPISWSWGQSEPTPYAAVQSHNSLLFRLSIQESVCMDETSKRRLGRAARWSMS